jgi:hypothetical protein
MKTCKNCRYFKPFEIEYYYEGKDHTAFFEKGGCTFMPPQVFYRKSDTARTPDEIHVYTTAFPTMHQDQSCGQHKKRTAPRVTNVKYQKKENDNV